MKISRRIAASPSQFALLQAAVGGASRRTQRTRLLVVVALIVALAAAALTASAGLASTAKSTGKPHWLPAHNQNTPVVHRDSVGRINEVDYKIAIPASSFKSDARPSCTNGVRKNTVKPDVACNPYLTPSQAISRYQDDTIGPSTYTDQAVGKFGAFTKHGTGSNAYWTSSIKTTCQACTMAEKPGAVYRPDSWYNPTSWSWSGIFAGAWNKVIKPCSTGVVKSGSFAYGGAAASHLWFYTLSKGDSVLDVTPQGLAITALGGCLFNIATTDTSN